MTVRSSWLFPFIAVVIGVAPGTTVTAGELQPDVRRRFAESTDEVPDFQRHVVPLLGRLGCNGRSCHGSFQGQGGFRLSLFGYDFAMDHQGLTGASQSSETPRVDLEDAAQSLILKKPTLQSAHEGGKRFDVDSWEARLLSNWIAGGAPGTSTKQEIDRLEVSPAEILFGDSNKAQPLSVIAVWGDGSREDVTSLCRFRSNDDSVATVEDGNVSSVSPGDTHVVVFYDNGVTAIPVLRPFPERLQNADEEVIATETTEGIDTFVAARLRKLKLTPSAVCTDTEFLRRVSIDLTGTLPSPAEAREFLADSSLEKRSRKIEELLERPAYAAWWANKLCDYTGCNPRQQAELGQTTSVQWYMWVYQRLLDNEPYDELVEKIVLAQGRGPGKSYREYAEEMTAEYRDDSAARFSQRPGMPHYWTRRSMEKPEEAAQAFAHNFLGIRLQCAQCHKHPFAPWSQQDFQQFSEFFQPIRFGVHPDSQAEYRALAREVGLNVKGSDGTAVRDDLLRKARNGKTIPWRELYVVPREETQSLQLLRDRIVSLSGDEDPRLPIMEWMKEPQNPWFARAFVNRVWAGYFNTGLIDPPDDLNPANPPSHPELLNWLTEEFVRRDFNMKWLHREITVSGTYQRSWRPRGNNAQDRRNLSRHIPRRLPAEVVYDAVKQVLASDESTQDVRTDLTRRAIGHLSMRLAGTYAMQVLGKPDRLVNCDCERSNQPTLLQSVFLQNDPLIEQRLEGSGWLRDIAADEASRMPVDRKQLIEDAWLRTLGRNPTEAESTRALRHLDDAPSVVDGLRDLLWALLNTKEFVLIR